jgi:hypothetical protein
LKLAGAVVALVLLGAGAWWLLSGAPTRDSSRSDRQDPPPPPITRRAAGPAGWSIAPAQTVAIDRRELPDTGVVQVDLVLGEPSENREPLSGRILSIDPDRPDRVRDLSGEIVGEERGSARIGVSAEFLTPDTYLIEIRTTEKSHFPLRRYRLEVR